MTDALSPYRMLYTLASSQWDDFLSETIKVVLPNGLEQPSDSCVTTCVAISALYLGVEQARGICQDLTKPLLLQFDITFVPNKPINYVIWNLFSGLNGDQRSYAKYTKKMDEQIRSIASPIIFEMQKGKISELQAVQQFDQNLGCIEFNFNYKVIKNFEREIFACSEFVNANRSYLFVAGIRFQNMLQHVFALEVYYSPIIGKHQVRLLHSWINIAAFIDTIKDRGYAEGDEGTWGLEDIPRFIQLLHEALEPNSNRTQESYRKCFGYGSCDSPLTFLREIQGKKVLGGINFRYDSYPFLPYDYEKNLKVIFPQQT